MVLTGLVRSFRQIAFLVEIVMYRPNHQHFSLAPSRMISQIGHGGSDNDTCTRR